MSDHELDDLLSQLKDTCQKNCHDSTSDINTTLKKIDVFINRRQMKLMNHNKHLEGLQHNLLLSECKNSRNRTALEKKDLEVNQLHLMLNKAEHTTQNIIMKYDTEVQKLTKQLSNVQQEYDRLKKSYRTNQDNRSMNDALSEIARLRELNKMLEIDNQRLYAENNHLKETNCQSHYSEETNLREKNVQLEKLIHSLQCSNQQLLSNQSLNSTYFETKIKTLQDEIDFYKSRSNEQEIEIRRLINQLNNERDQHKNEFEIYRKNFNSDEMDKLRVLLNNSEQQCNVLRLELQRLQTEREILKVRLIEEKMMDNSMSDINRQIDNIEHEKFIRNELDINIDQANKLINYTNCHKKILEEKIQELTDEINQLKKENKTNNANDLSVKIYQCNENILYAKREINKLQMEVTDKNTIIYNLYKKIECLEQALAISKQRMNSQLNEIEELRSRYQIITSSIKTETKHIPIFTDGLSIDDEGQMRQSIGPNKTLCTSSPIKSADIHNYFRNIDTGGTTTSIGIRCQNQETFSSDHRNILSR